MRGVLTRREWLSVGGMAAAVLGLHVLGWGVLLLAVVPHHYEVGPGQVFGVGLGITAYTLGMRHAFDADHVAAIDNTTRKLMAERGRPLSVGFWFSLGHSSVVFALCLVLSFGVKALAGEVTDGTSALHTTAGLVGTAISGVFLYAIAALNLVILVGIIRVFRAMRRGSYDEAALEEHLANRGFLNRILRGVTGAVRRPRQMYPVGVLFGLGFDTASEVSLLVIAGGAAAFSLPWYAVLTLPVLFAAGMSLLDAVDGCFMNFAYGWAFSTPVRKVYYNLTITGLSIAVAVVIGTIELMSIAADRLTIDSGPIAAVAGLDLNAVGYAIVGLFVLTWVCALAFWRLARLEDRWQVPSTVPSAVED